MWKVVQDLTMSWCRCVVCVLARLELCGRSVCFTSSLVNADDAYRSLRSDGAWIDSVSDGGIQAWSISVYVECFQIPSKAVLVALDEVVFHRPSMDMELVTAYECSAARW